VVHVDFSARLQTVRQSVHPDFHQLITEFHKQTGVPMVINTSFNVRGEPIVCTPQQAFRCFMTTEMDALVIGQYLLLKTEQLKIATATERQQHLEQFPLD
ncbi:MAG: carbamoyltransferase C-terminal domain-containing protein, partial [Rubripirellula sp.]